MAASLPVVASRVGGNAEQVLDGITGYLFPVGNYVGCAGAVEKLIVSVDRCKQMGAQGREHVRELFNEKRMAENMTGIYKELLNNKQVKHKERASVIPAPFGQAPIGRSVDRHRAVGAAGVTWVNDEKDN